MKISDNFTLNQCLAPNAVHFLTWGKVDASTSGKIHIQVGPTKAVMTYDYHLFDVSVEPIELTDKRLSHIWGSNIYRLAFTAKQQVLNGTYHFTLTKQR